MSDAAHCQDQVAGSYTPMMSSEDTEDLRRWHERAYQERRAQAVRDQIFDYLGLSIVVPPDVQPVTGVSHLLGEAVLAEVEAAEKVLDMGTGSGINAILAASQGAQVIAVDVNPHALEATWANADRNGIGDRIEIRRSDVFSTVDEVFDLIIFDPPFRWFTPRDLLEAATADKDYRVLTTFSGRPEIISLPAEGC